MGRSCLRGLIVIVCAGLVAGGCRGGDGEGAEQSWEKKIVTQLGEADKERSLLPAELDSLRALKARLKITRDEYWADKGGVLGNDKFEVWYPAGRTTVTFAMYAFKLLDAADKKLRENLGRAPEKHLKLVGFLTMDEYTRVSGQEWWRYSKIDGDEISMQPLSILSQRGLLDIAVPHEYFVWAIDGLTRERSPRWLVEGLSSRLSGESWVLKNQLTEFTGTPVKMEIDDIDSALKKKSDRKMTRFAYYNAYRMVEQLVNNYGMDAVVSTIDHMAAGEKTKKAFEKGFGKPYKEVVAEALSFTVE